MSLTPKPSLAAALLGLASVTGLGAWSTIDAAPAQSSDSAVYEVAITNVTRGQIFSPPVVATHTASMEPLFTLGSPASPELAGVAEDALNQPLIDKLMADSEVFDVKMITGAGGPIMPGETARVLIRAPNQFDRLSLAGMLVITNDAFFAVNGAKLLRNHDTLMLRSAAYDAGSEANNEDCDFIPGPPCNNPMVRMTTGAEGYVHVHAGIHGIEDLMPSMYDWRGDVAAISIRRM